MLNFNGKVWIWYVMDYFDDELKCEQFFVRFKILEIANKFKEVFDNVKKKLFGLVFIERTFSFLVVSGIFFRLLVILQILLSEDDDVIYIKKEMVILVQVEMVRKFKLFDYFYLYENVFFCFGCIGCEDYKEGIKIIQKIKFFLLKKV